MTGGIPAELDALLEAAAKARRVPKTTAVWEMLEAGLRSEGLVAGRASAYDRVKDLCGVLEGLADLSTTPKYMEGFGE